MSLTMCMRSCGEGVRGLHGNVDGTVALGATMAYSADVVWSVANLMATSPSVRFSHTGGRAWVQQADLVKVYASSIEQAAAVLKTITDERVAILAALIMTAA
eukprot:SM000011S19185  [mRNA]  locus=s11:1285732:1286457:+ [translate_table: standard]